MDDDQDLEIIRQRRAAILEKIKNKAASNISQVPLIPASTSQSRPQVQEDDQLTIVLYFTRVARFGPPISISRTFLLRQNRRMGVP